MPEPKPELYTSPEPISWAYAEGWRDCERTVALAHKEKAAARQREYRLAHKAVIR